MGSPPPTDYPAPTTTASASASAFTEPTEQAGPCGISLALPKFKLGASLGLPVAIPPALPSLNVHFRLSCDPNNPVDVSSQLAWGAGRTTNAPPDPDDDENAPTF